uniref:Uncharacterized protein n=1 Tax=Timema poppense TaxID=170557 RepID=A0A7R9D7L5_TIMPO|nr:unnamed protein product [Timema poppensis]
MITDVQMEDFIQADLALVYKGILQNIRMTILAFEAMLPEYRDEIIEFVEQNTRKQIKIPGGVYLEEMYKNSIIVSLLGQIETLVSRDSGWIYDGTI